MSPIRRAPLFDATRYNLPAATARRSGGQSRLRPRSTPCSPSMAMTATAAPAPTCCWAAIWPIILDTGGGADTIVAGDGNDVITISDNAAWNIDGGDGIDTVRLSGAFNLAAAPEGQNADQHRNRRSEQDRCQRHRRRTRRPVSRSTRTMWGEFSATAATPWCWPAITPGIPTVIGFLAQSGACLYGGFRDRGRVVRPVRIQG